MTSFGVGDRVEAIDECGVWSKGQILEIRNGSFLVTFDGFGSEWDTLVESIAIRSETLLELPKKRAIHELPVTDLKRLQRGDTVWMEDGREVTVATVDPIRKKLLVECDDGAIEILPNEFRLQPPQVQMPKVHRTKRPKTVSTRLESINPPNVEAPKPEDRHINKSTACINTCIYVYYLRGDGMWLRVGDVVSTEGIPLPFIISSIFGVGDQVNVKLLSVDGSKLRENFMITCGVGYVRVFSGNKVCLCRGDRDRVEDEAFRNYTTFMSGDVNGETKLEMRRMILGHAMRAGLSGGFSNLSSIRLNLGPSDVLFDGKIFNFVSLTAVRKFSLMCEGDFEFLDGLMGKEWDCKLGRAAESSFFKYVTEIQVKRAGDLSLIVTAKFATSQFGFTDTYRLECRAAIKDGKEQLMDINADIEKGHIA